MHDEGMIFRPALDLIDAADGRFVLRVGSQAVYGLRREGDQTPGAQLVDGALDEDLLCRGRDSLRHDARRLDLVSVLPAVSRQEVDASRAEIGREIDVVRMVAHDERLARIDAVFALREKAEIRLGLDAGAAVGRLMRAAVNRSNRNPGLAKGPDDPLVYLR